MAANLDKPVVELILPNSIGHERIAMASLASFAKMHGYSLPRIEELKTVVAEAALNAMEHGNKGQSDAVVNIVFHYGDDAIHILVMDQGEGIKAVVPQPDIERILRELDPPVGFEIFLIRQLADEVEFNTDVDRGHCMKMVIRK